jgi:hypothetical protein
MLTYRNEKGRAILVTSRGSTWYCETSRLPHFLDNRLTQMEVNLSALRTCRALPQERLLVLISCQRSSQTQGHNAAVRMRYFEKSNNFVGKWTSNLLACSIVPQRNTLQHASAWNIMYMKWNMRNKTFYPFFYPIFFILFVCCSALRYSHTVWHLGNCYLIQTFFSHKLFASGPLLLTTQSATFSTQTKIIHVPS